MSTFHHKKGVSTGDLGSKFGYTSKDNGWAMFDKVRIPREDMLMGFSSVEKDGTFSITGDLRVMYTVMMTIRLCIVKDCYLVAGQTLQIALRYNACRRQFKTQHGTKDERKTLDYQSQ